MNTDGMISCFDCTSQLVSIGLEKKKEKGMRATLWGRLHLAQACTLSSSRFFGFCLFLGELLKPWGSCLREIQTSISHNM